MIEFLVSRGLFRNSEFNFWTPRIVWRHVLRGRFVIECLVSRGRFSTPRLARDREKAKKKFLESSTYGRASRGEGEIKKQQRDPEKEIA